MSKEYRLSEAAKIIGVHRDTVIYWEEKGYIPKARRNSNNHRVYNTTEIEKIKEIRGIK